MSHGFLECHRDYILVSFKELDWETRFQREKSDFFPPPRELRVLSNLFNFKGIQAPNIVKKSSRWRASRIAWKFELRRLTESPILSVTWRLGGCGCLWLKIRVIKGILCSHNNYNQNSIIVEVLDKLIFYQEEQMYHNARKKGGTTITILVFFFSLSSLILLYYLYMSFNVLGYLIWLWLVFILNLILIHWIKILFKFNLITIKLQLSFKSLNSCMC